MKESIENMICGCGSPYHTKICKLERCGFCGAFFVGNEYLNAEQLNSFPKNALDNIPLGYCANAQQEDYEQNPY